ncbi:hypothetical protein G6F48_012873 [Rhizopus delemar]|nr:hypothetical protein G6F48_012873 [Rhizopus delemar]
MIVCYTANTTNNEETAEGNVDETEQNGNTEQDEQCVDIVECKKRLREAYETILMYEVPLDDLDSPTPYSKQVNIRLAVFEIDRYVKKFLKTDKACKGVHPVVPPVLTRKYIGLLVLKGDRQTARGKFLRLMELGLSMSSITAYLGHRWRQILLDKIKQHIATISPRPYSEAWRACFNFMETQIFMRPWICISRLRLDIEFGSTSTYSWCNLPVYIEMLRMAQNTDLLLTGH